MVRGRLRLEYDGEAHYIDAGLDRAFRRRTGPTGWAPSGGTTEVLVVAVDAPHDLRNHPLFARQSRPLTRRR